jgi:hypothetical protein
MVAREPRQILSGNARDLASGAELEALDELHAGWSIALPANSLRPAEPWSISADPSASKSPGLPPPSLVTR